MSLEGCAHQIGAGDLIADLGLSHLLHLPDDVWDGLDAVFDGSGNVPGILCLGIPVHRSICTLSMPCQIELCHPVEGLALGHSSQALLGGPCLGFNYQRSICTGVVSLGSHAAWQPVQALCRASMKASMTALIISLIMRTYAMLSWIAWGSNASMGIAS